MPWSPESRAAAAERMRALNADPEFKKRNAERMRALNADPEFKKRQAEAASERMRALNADPEFKAKLGHDLPPLSESQRKIYNKLRPVVGREAALAEATRPTA